MRDGDHQVLPDERGGRWLRRHIPGPVVAVTTTAPGGYRGATVTSLIPVSVKPIQVLVALEEESQMLGWIAESGRFAVNVLPWREQFIADQFAGFAPRASPTFAGIAHTVGEAGAPVLKAAIAWAECIMVQTIVTGDHTCVVGEVLALGGDGADEDDPLLYFLNRYHRLQ